MMRAAPSVQERQHGKFSPLEIVLPAVLIAGAEVARIRAVDQRLLLLAVGMALTLGVWRVARSGAPTRVSLLRGVGAAAVACLMIALVPWALGAPGYASATNAVLPVLAMIAGTLWLRWDEAAPLSLPARSPRMRPGAWLAICLVGFAVLVTVAHRLLVGDFPELTDEASYMLQAKWMRMPGFSWHFDPALKDFFTERHLIDRPGQLATLYPPGWPTVLALFNAVGLGAQWGLFVGSLTLVCTYRIGVLLHGPRVAVLAVVLLASSQWFLNMYASYMSHGATMMFAAGGALAMLEADRRAGRQQAALWAGAGAMFSFAVAARPLTGAALGAGLVLWTWLRGNVPLTQRIRPAVFLVLGALPGVAGILYYNAATTGAPLLFGYEAVYGSMQSLGFGERGWLVYDDALVRVPSGADFTPQVAARNASILLADAAMTWLPLFGLAPFLLAARHVGVRWSARSWLPLLLLPVAYFFYFFKDLRFWIEALPYFALGTAWLGVRILDHAPALGRQLVAIALVGQAALVFAGDGVQPFADRPWKAYMPGTAARVNFEAIEQLRARHGKLLIFARENGPGFAPLRDRLMVYNGEGESGDVLVARDLGERNVELMRRHPDRTPFLFKRKRANGRVPATVTPLERLQ